MWIVLILSLAAMSALKIALCFTIFFALLILAVDFFECRAMGAQLYMNEEGIGVRRFGKTKVFIKWNEIKPAKKSQ